VDDLTYGRTDRVAERVKRELSDVLQRDINDPRLKDVVVSRVRMSNDNQVAWVLLSVWPVEIRDDVTKALERASGYLRRAVGRRLTLRHSPDLRFEFDDGASHLLGMDALLKNADMGPDPKETDGEDGETGGEDGEEE
jgi:ribosome-binding factor A